MIQVQHYTWLIWRRLWLIVLGVALCTGATYFISNRSLPTYEASALLQVTAPGTSNDVFSNQAVAVSDALQITNDDVLLQATKVLKGVTLQQLQQVVSASPVDSTELIQIRADATDGNQAAAITNAVVNAYIQTTTKAETARLQGTANQLAQQLLAAKTNLDQAQSQLTTLQQNNAPATQINQQASLVNTYQLSYDSLLSNYNDIELQKATVAQHLTVVQLATPPAQPLGSRKWLNTAIAAALSLLLMIVLVLLLDWVDMSIKTPEDVAQLALLEPLGSIPLRKRTKARGKLDLFSDDNATERAFAIISTSFHALNTGQRSLLVTGLHAGSGSSTVAAKLAISLAQMGTRVLLVDANLHRPVLHNLFNVSNTHGLASSQADVHVLQMQPQQMQAWLNRWVTNVPNLWVLPAGPVASSSVAILRSLEFRKLIGWLLQEHVELESHKLQAPVDIVIFDTPALEEEADTITLAPLCDSAILVLQAGRERKETIKKAELTLQRLGAPILGIVVNRQKPTYRPYLYTRQLPQSMPGIEIPTMHAEVKYPLLQRQTLSLRAIPKPQSSVQRPVPVKDTGPATVSLPRVPRTVQDNGPATVSLPKVPRTMPAPVKDTGQAAVSQSETTRTVPVPGKDTGPAAVSLPKIPKTVPAPVKDNGSAAVSLSEATRTVSAPVKVPSEPLNPVQGGEQGGSVE